MIISGTQGQIAREPTLVGVVLLGLWLFHVLMVGWCLRWIQAIGWSFLTCIFMFGYLFSVVLFYVALRMIFVDPSVGRILTSLFLMASIPGIFYIARTGEKYIASRCLKRHLRMTSLS